MRLAPRPGPAGDAHDEGAGSIIFIAFSTENADATADTGVARIEMLPNARINPLIAATIQATEEAILNVMLAAETMTGADDLWVFALPHDRLLTAMRNTAANLGNKGPSWPLAFGLQRLVRIDRHHPTGGERDRRRAPR